jgi:uncharacterized repeat protein (TIGR02543 family)
LSFGSKLLASITALVLPLTFIVSQQPAALASSFSAQSTTPNCETFATGGTASVFTDSDGDDYCRHVFTEVGSHAFTVVDPRVTEVDYLVVAGGGGGASHVSGGGGGAGGLLSNLTPAGTDIAGLQVTVGTSVALMVGAGGTGGDNSDGALSTALKGGNSSLGDLEAIGGGPGGRYPDTNAALLAGGSGGGAGRGLTSSGSEGESGQGNGGGKGAGNVGGGGGGGGAGAVGQNAPSSSSDSQSRGGRGGAGLNYSEFFGADIGDSGWFAGGGAGAAHHTSSQDRSTGGQGGGGDEGVTNSEGGIAGVANTGGGGGAARNYTSGDGGNGGSGAVVIRYALPITTVVFNANSADATGTMADQVGTSSNNLNANTFTRTNYRFDGWSTNSDGSTLDYADEATFDFSVGGTVPLYARWAIDGEIVTFNANAGSGSMDPQIAKTSTALTANAFTNGNKTFREWSTEQDGSGDTYLDQASYPFATSGSQVLYAQWDDAPNKTVEFNANGGTGTMANQVTNETTALSANEFQRDNFAFEKWNTEADGTGISFNDEGLFDFDQDLVLYAQWVETQAFSVTFNGNGANSGSMAAQTSSEPAALRTSTFLRNDKTFMGWATTRTGSVEYENGDIYPFDQDTILYAVWGNTAAVKFDANAAGTTGSMPDQQLAANAKLRFNAFERSGFVFSHWATTPSGGGTKYPDGWAGPALPSSVTLYAQWVGDTGAMVSFNANGGRLGTLMPPQGLGTADALSRNSFVAPERRVFRGWSTEADGSGTFFSNQQEASFSQDTVLYAQWGFNVELRPNGGTPRSNISVVIESPGQIPENPYARSGQVFIGWTAWNGNRAPNSAWFGPEDPISLGNRLILVAQWAPAPSAGENYVTFAPNNGELITGDDYLQVQSSAVPTRLKPNPYQLSGHSFFGWRTSRHGPIVYSDEDVFAFDQPQVLHAAWTQNRVRFESNGGNGSAYTQNSKTNANLLGNRFTKAGHTFTGWNTAKDGTGKRYAQNQEFPFALPEQIVTLYAQWEAEDATKESIFFNANGATAGFMARQFETSAANLDANQFTRTGYQFAGWNTAANGSGTPYADGANYDFGVSDVLFAQWIPLVTYRANGGTGATSYQEIESTSLTLLPNTYTKAGEIFLGWATSPGGNPIYADAQTLTLSSITNTGALDLYAIWFEPPAGQKTVVYHSNFAASPRILTQSSGAQAQLNKTFLEWGHTLLGWATTPSGSVEYQVRSQYDFSADIVLYGVWQVNTVSFDANGGVGTMANQSRTHNGALVENEFTRTGFVFSTWNTEPDGSGKTYSSGVTYPFRDRNSSTTLYAQWLVVPGSQVVNFNSNGGSGSMRTQVGATNTDIVIAPNGFNRSGFTFVEWNTKADGTGDEYQEGQTFTVGTSNLTLFAQWASDGSITDQTVTFDANGGTGSMTDQTVNGRTVLSSNAFTRNNAVFTGWNTEQNGTGLGYADNSQILALGPVTLYAQWIVLQSNEVALSFDPNGGTGSPISPITGVIGTSETLPSNSFSRAGFKFLGWDTDKDATSASLDVGDSYTLPAVSEKLYAIWEAQFFTVTFDANAATATGTMANQTSDEAANLFANKFERDKHEFLGWDESATATTATYADAASFPFTQSVTLHAIWEQTDFTVTFDSNGGSGQMSAQTASGTQPLAANTFTRSGHRFVGWALTVGGSKAFDNAASFSFSQDTNLFAVWEQLSVVTFDSNGGTGSMATQSGLNPAPLRLNEFKNTGFTFAGWKTSAAGTEADYVDGASYSFSASETLYAHWEPTTYTVTFNANDGTGSMPSQTAAGLQSLDLMDGLSRTGYTFLGWNRNSNASTALFSDGGSFDFKQDTILYAIWSKTQNSVTWDSNGGSSVLGTNFVIGDTIAEPSDPTKSGKVFGGWSTSETGDQGDVANIITSWPFTPPAPTNTTFYAVWFDICSITQSSFTLNGDDYIGISVTSGSNCVLELPEDVTTVDLLVVGGGGGGGANVGSGGGGGGVSVKTSVSVTPGERIFATVGQGGTGGKDGVSLNANPGGRSEIALGSLNLFANGGFGGTTLWSEDVAFMTCQTGAGTRINDSAPGGTADTSGDAGVGGTGASGGAGPAGSSSNGDDGGAGFSIDFLGTTVVYGSGGGGAGFEGTGGAGGAGAGNGGTWADVRTGWNALNNQGGGGGGGEQACSSGGAGGSGLVALRFIAPTYTVEFETGGVGSGSLADLTKTFEQDLQLPNSSQANFGFERAGFMVGGWSVVAGGPQVYALGAMYTIDEDVTLYPVWKPLSATATGDTYVQSGQSASSNFGSSDVLVLKNASNSLTSNSNRIAYLSFSYSPNIVWSDGVLEVVVVDNFDGSSGSAYGNSYTSFNLDVYGATDASWDEGTLSFQGANGSQEGWGLNTDSWPWSPNLATHLGTISIPTNSQTEGQKFSLSSEALDEFLNADSDGEITLILVRRDTDPEGNLSLASKENTSYAGPTLALAGAGYEYTVAYDLNGGTGTAPSSGVFTNGGSGYTVEGITGITAPTNKTLVGWNSKADGSGVDYAPGDVYSTSRSLTLYAKYIANPQVTFVSSFPGGAVPTTQSISPSVATDLRANAFRQTGYAFASWNTEVDGSGTSYLDEEAVTITEDLTLYAQWLGVSYTVSYDYNGADGGDGQATDAFTTGEAAVDLAVPTRTGYTFDGWFEDSNFAGTAVSSPYATDRDLTLYAKWLAIDYSVNYEDTASTSGAAPSDTKDYNIGDTAVVKANTILERTGYNFIGWTDNSAGNGTVYESGDTYTVGSADITFYPKWEAATYNVTFNSNGGGTAPASDTFTTATTGLTLPTQGSMTKIGYDFDGWSLSVGGAKLAATGFETTSDLTLYARWTIKSITASFAEGTLPGGGSSGITIPSDVTQAFATQFILPTPAQTEIDNTSDSVIDFVFAGWSDGSNVFGAGDNYRLGENDVTFTAKWIRVLQVRYIFNGGTAASGNNERDSQCTGTDDTCAVDDKVDANKTPTRAGYNFVNWKAQNGNLIDAEEEFTVANDRYILTAQWSAIQYNFSFDTDGGDNPTGDATRTIGQILTLPSPGERTGYTFDGWWDGSTTYPAGSAYVVGDDDEDFVAQWTANVYTLTLDWQGGQLRSGQSALTSDFYTVGTGYMSLPVGSNYERDGYSFAGWSTSIGGAVLTSHQPTQDGVLYAVWVDGDFSVTIDPKGGTPAQTTLSVARGGSLQLPSVTRDGFVFTGWFSDPTAGAKLGDAGDNLIATASQTIYARWIQKSLFGIDMAELETVAELNVGSTTGGSISRIHGTSATSAQVVVPSGALPDGTKVSVRFFKDTRSQASIIAGNNDYIVSLLVSWLTGTGDAATVPDTDPNKPIQVTLTSPAIKAGQRIFQLIGDQVTDLGVAQIDGEITVYITEDPAIVIAATRPDAPTSVGVIAGDAEATISWSAPATDGGSEITGYLVTASSGQSCTTTATSCVIEGLTNGVAYTFNVVATNQIGDSNPSAPTSPVTPTPASYTVTFDSNGGSTVTAGNFPRAGTVSEPAAPTRSGFSFAGWSLVLDDTSTKVAFPYTPQLDRNLTLHALWEENTTPPVVNPPVVNPPTVNPPVVNPPAVNPPVDNPAPGTEGGSPLPAVSGQTSVWTKRISATEVKVYIKFPEMGAHYRINFQTNDGPYVNKMRRTINTTADSGLRVVGNWYYLVRTITLAVPGRYRIEVTQDGKRIPINGKTRPAVYKAVDNPAPGTEGGSPLPAVSGQTRVWTKRISATEVKVYIKFPEMGAHYRINFQTNDGPYVNKMRRTINSTADSGLRVVGNWYYLVRTITLAVPGRYRIEVTQDGERVPINDRNRPAVYTLARQ